MGEEEKVTLLKFPMRMLFVLGVEALKASAQVFLPDYQMLLAAVKEALFL